MSEQNYGLNPNIIRFYIFRKRMFQNYINEGHIGVILFPEIIKRLSIEEMNAWSGYDMNNYKYFLDTLAFLGLNFQTLTESYRNPDNNTFQGRLINSYKYFLQDDARFDIFFNKLMEMKRSIQEGNINTPTTIYDEETDTDDRTITEDNAELEDDDFDDELYDEYVIPNTLEMRGINKSPIQITINDNDEGLDLIEGDRKVFEYIAETPDNIVFIIKTKSGTNKYFLTSKEQLQNVIQNKTNIHYECLIFAPQLLYIPSKDVVKDKPLLKMTSIGLPVQYILLSEIKNILENNKQLYLISDEPIQKVKAVASHDILDKDKDMTSGSHCQYNEGDPPYSVYTLTYLDLDDVKEIKSPKKQRTIGGKRIKSAKTKTNKNKKSKKTKRSYSKIVKTKKITKRR
jgi:hypothetical protein